MGTPSSPSIQRAPSWGSTGPTGARASGLRRPGFMRTEPSRMRKRRLKTTPPSSPAPHAARAGRRRCAAMPMAVAMRSGSAAMYSLAGGVPSKPVGLGRCGCASRRSGCGRGGRPCLRRGARARRARSPRACRSGRRGRGRSARPDRRRLPARPRGRRGGRRSRWRSGRRRSRRGRLPPGA